MRRKRKAGWYLAAAVIAAACAVLYLNRESDVEETGREFPARAWIEAKEQENVSDVEACLKAHEQAEAQAQAEDIQTEQPPAPSDKQGLQKRFEGAVLVGDSVSEGFIDYEILSPACVVAKKGLRADSAAEDISKALSLAPSSLFLSMGLNDLEYCMGDSQRFIREYEERLQEIRDAAPELPVYVMAIMPILPEAVEKKPVLGYAEEFNEALKEMCGRWGLVFIDGGDILDGHEDWYQTDSIHLKSQPYLPLLERMEEAAGL